MKPKFLKKDNEIKVVFDENIEEGYTEIKAGTVDAALEKHVPVWEIKDNKLIVNVGKVPHPMTDEHYIMWICYVHDNKSEFHYLTSNDEPKTEFDYVNNGEVYAFCNLHSLWKSDVE